MQVEESLHGGHRGYPSIVSHHKLVSHHHPEQHDSQYVALLPAQPSSVGPRSDGWLFLFDTTPLAPLGTEVLIHLKPSRRLTWGYHAAKAWYLSHAANHYQCIRMIMHDTGAERVTDTFHYRHHAILVPHITATDRIIATARQLADAIQGIQEALANEMAAIASLCFLLLGETLSPDPTPPGDPATITHPNEPTDNYPPIVMWNQSAVIAPPAA